MKTVKKNGTNKTVGHRLGLGIDAGGTYTDIVIYDFQAKAVLAKSKALTTKWDFTIGIENAIEQLNEDYLKKIDLVSVSTTLATNAIVEGHGLKVGLLVMPPYGLFSPDDIEYEPKAVISGQLDIDGRELVPVDTQQVIRIAREIIRQEHVRAFAVSGFASTINPDHELAIKKILRQETHLSVTCGHELSEMLNFKTRATTAILNARIIPRLEKLLRDTTKTLLRRGIDAPVMVVKGDGSLMSAATAIERPVETILSGPAASVAGAQYLTGLADAIVVDMGGTTTDTAAVKNKMVRTCADGTLVSGHRTHVQALDMRTTGLGGDSLISFVNGNFRIGPLRVGPIAWLASVADKTEYAFDYLSRRLEDYTASTAPMELLVTTGHAPDFELTPTETDIITILSGRPHSIDELAAKLNIVFYGLLDTHRLEEHNIVQRCGLTPTDLLHVRGEFQRWNTEAAHRMCRMMAGLANMEVVDMIDYLGRQVVRNLAMEAFKKQLDQQTEPDAIDNCPVCRTLLDNVFKKNNDGYKVRITLDMPIIGVGAPIHYFLPQAAEYLGTQAVIPENADVANAIGAITSDVLVCRHVQICPDTNGGFIIEGLPGAKRFVTLEEAHTYAVGEIETIVRQLAKMAGTCSTDIHIEFTDSAAPTSGGKEVLIARIITAYVKGRPDGSM